MAPVSRRRFGALAFGAGLGYTGAALGKPARPSAAPGAIIDSHVHVWKIDPRYPFTNAPTVARPDRDATPEMLLALMKAHGVKKSVLVQVSHHGWDHRYLIATLKQHPRSFIGVARVNPADPAAPDELSRLVKEHGMRGLRLNVQPDPAFDFVRGPLMPPLFRRCQTLQIPLGLQTKAARLPELFALCERLPELTVIIDHMADVALDNQAGIAALLAFARLPRAFVKLTHTWLLSKQSFPFTDAQALVKRVYDAFGPKRLLYGSDWPGVEKYAPYGKTIALVRDELAFLNADDRREIFAGTAARIWPGLGA
jgi:predicted TIM-barrel fold metal-dependent hydrolase